MGDSPKFVDSPTVPQDSVGHFSDLAQRILAGQIASRSPQTSNSDNANIAPPTGSSDNSNVGPPTGSLDNSNNLQTGSNTQPWWHGEQASPPPRQNPVPPAEPWRPMQIDPPAWARPQTWLPSTQPSLLPNNLRPGFDLERIPTLLTGQPANQDDSTIYHTSSKEAQIYDANRSSIVRVFGHGKDLPIDREYTGTGFFVSDHGDIATAYHVISNLESIRVTTSDGIEHPGKVVATRPTADVAIIHIDTSQSTKPVTLADSSNLLHGGDPLYTIGHPAGWTKEYLSPGQYQSTDTARDITGFRDIDQQNPNHILLTVSQNIQGGDSGGPVIDANGKVVGIVSRGDQGSHGYMVSVNDLWPLMNQVSAPRQSTNYQPSDIPFKPHFGFDETTYSVTSAMTVSQMLGRSSLSQSLGMAGRGLAAGFAGVELWHQDLPFLQTAFAHGTTREKISAVADVGADALMIGGAAMSIVPELRPLAPAASLAGSLLKLGNGVTAFRTYS